MGNELGAVRPRPIAVVICSLLRDGRILLIRRKRGDYVGLWGLPGGKIEEGEHLDEAAVREVREESGISAEFRGYLGVVSELLVEGGAVIRHFLLHVCEMVPRSAAISEDSEGRLEWFDLAAIGAMKTEIIPSDFVIIEKMVSKRERTYYRCVLEKSGSAHALRQFE